MAPRALMHMDKSNWRGKNDWTIYKKYQNDGVSVDGFLLKPFALCVSV